MSARRDEHTHGRAARVFSVLLRALPREQRSIYGAEMAALFAEQLEEARSRGSVVFAWTFLAACADAATRGVYERWRRRGRSRQRPERGTSGFGQDVRFAVRTFSRQKGATALVVATLALAVAANTAVYTLLDGLFLRPFPFAAQDRLVYLNEAAPRWNLEYTGVNYPDFDGWRRRSRTFESMALWATATFNLSDGTTAERVDGAVVTYDLATTLGIRPVLGRAFTAEEDRPKGPRVAMIGYGLWQSRYAGETSVIGRVMHVNSEPYTIIGVLPKDLEFPPRARLWLPLGGDPDQPYQDYSFDGVGRLRPGVSLAQARADLRRAHEPIWLANDTSHTVSPTLLPLRERFAGDFKAMGGALGVGVFLVLLIACANVAGTMLARATFRQRELSLRMALGAGASRVARLLFTEALVLATVGGALGALLGHWGLHALAHAAGERMPAWVHLDADARTVLFAVALVMGSAVLFGLAPALHARRTDVRSSLASEGRAMTSRAHRRSLNALVVLENALAAVLIVAAALLGRAYLNVRDADPGFDVRGAATFRLALPAVKYRNGVEQRTFYERVLQGLRALPGVTAAAAVTCPPFTCHQGRFYEAEGGTPPGPDGSDPVVLTVIASPDYLAASGMHLLHGRFYAEGEGRPASPAAVVNESFARRLGPRDPDPVGRRARPRGNESGEWSPVLGIVRDVRHYGLDQPARPTVFVSMTVMDTSAWGGSMAFVVRTAGDPDALAPDIRRVVRQLDPELPVYAMSTLERLMDDSLAVRRTLAFSLLAFAVVALVLAVGGVYAVLSYLVGRRRREIGIRVALGAPRHRVVTSIVGEGASLVATGLAVGLPSALLTSRYLEEQLAGMSAHDPVVYAISAAALLATGIVAAAIPARRAATVHPAETMSQG